MKKEQKLEAQTVLANGGFWVFTMIGNGKQGKAHHMNPNYSLRNADGSRYISQSGYHLSCGEAQRKTLGGEVVFSGDVNDFLKERRTPK